MHNISQTKTVELTQGQCLQLDKEDMILQAWYGVEGNDRDVTNIARAIDGWSTMSKCVVIVST